MIYPKIDWSTKKLLFVRLFLNFDTGKPCLTLPHSSATWPFVDFVAAEFCWSLRDYGSRSVFIYNTGGYHGHGGDCSCCTDCLGLSRMLRFFCSTCEKKGESNARSHWIPLLDFRNRFLMFSSGVFSQGWHDHTISSDMPVMRSCLFSGGTLFGIELSQIPKVSKLWQTWITVHSC